MKTSNPILVGGAMAAWVCLACCFGSGQAGAATPAPMAAPPSGATSLSTNVTELVRLAESGVEEDVILAYIENGQTPFEISADDIIYLQDLGVSSDIITAMLRRDAVLREQGARVGTAPGAGTKVQEPAATVPDAPEPIYVTNAPAPVAYFHDSLAPYGSWIELEGQGWGWQPRVVVIDRHWQPYWHGGRWLYTDFGWYWHSDYSWGWAPFHYGRWHRHHRHGWVWYPDLAWGPAWVSWRYSDRYCGWAPLPPGAHFAVGQGWRFNNVSVGINFDFNLGPDRYNFVEIRHLHEPRPRLHGIAPAQSAEIRSKTTVINNYVLGQNNRVINQGVAADRVAAASGREIRPATVREVAVPSEIARRDHLAREGAATVLYRPELKPPVNPRPVVAQKIDERHPIVRPTPKRPILTGRSGGPAPTTRTMAPDSVPTATAPAPKRTESRPIPSAPAPVPVTPRGTAVRPSPPIQKAPVQKTPVAPAPVQKAPVQPAPSTPRSVPVRPTVPALPRRPSSTPERIETPKGHEQRISHGAPMQRHAPAPPGSSPPPRQKGTAPKPSP